MAKVIKSKEIKSNSDVYEIYLGTFINNAFTWYSIKKMKDPTTAYKEFKKYVNSQLKYTDEELQKVWDTGRLDIELRQGNKLLNWVGIYSRETKPLSKKEEEEAEKGPVKKSEKKSDKEEDSKKDSKKSKKDSVKEIKDSFDIDVSEQITQQIWDQINEKLKDRSVDVRDIVKDVHDALEEYENLINDDDAEELREWMADIEDDLNSPGVNDSVKEIDDAAGEPIGQQAKEAINFIKDTRCEIGEAIEWGERDRGLFVRISRPISSDTVAFGVVFLNGDRIFKMIGDLNEVRIKMIDFLKDPEGWIEPEPQEFDDADIDEIDEEEDIEI